MWMRFVSGHTFRHAAGIPTNDCHSEPGVQPGEESASKSFRADCRPGIAPLARFLIALVFLSALSAPALAADPQSLLAAGRVDDVIQQLRNPYTADSYNLLCRAHFELGEWDA